MVAYYDDNLFKYDKILVPISDYKITRYPKNKNMLAVIRYFERNKIFNSVTMLVDTLNHSDIEILGTNITNNCQRPRQQNKMELHFNVFDKLKIPYIDIVKQEEQNNIIYRSVKETKLVDNSYKEIIYILEKMNKINRIIERTNINYLELTKNYNFDITFTSITDKYTITINIQNLLLELKIPFPTWEFNTTNAKKIKGIEHKKVYHELMTYKQWKQIEEQEKYKKQEEIDNMLHIATEENPKYLIMENFKSSIEVVDYNYYFTKKEENYV